MSIKAIKVIGVAVTILGAGLSLVGNWVEDKKLDAKIDAKIANAFKQLND